MLPVKLKPNIKSQIEDAELLKKLKAENKPKASKSNSILDIIETMRADVNKNLGQYENRFKLITTAEDLNAYIERANMYGKIAIDTETTGLDPIDDDIVGLCLYFPGEKAVYVPINHVDYVTGNRIENQVTREEAKAALEKLTAKVIMHNAQFDIRVIKHNLGIQLKCYWDTQLAATVLNENERHGLKILHGKYISHIEEKSFSDYFKDVKFSLIPIDFAYLYAANDAVDTFDLYEFQSKYLNNDPSNRQDRLDMYNLFMNIEMGMVDVIVALEDNGVAVDLEYLSELKNMYHDKLDKALRECYAEIDKYKDEIDKYRKHNPNNKLEDPINIGSTTQLGILFFDILKVEPIEGKKSTDKKAMEIYAKSYPIAKKILDYRSATKMTSTYIDNIISIMKDDGRVHTHFHSMGAKTGRMSSSDPLNLQNIPARGPNKIIRRMFVGQTTEREVEKRYDNAYILNREEEVQLQDGTWVWAELVKVGDVLESGETVKVVKVKEFKVLIGID